MAARGFLTATMAAVLVVGAMQIAAVFATGRWTLPHASGSANVGEAPAEQTVESAPIPKNHKSLGPEGWHKGFAFLARSASLGSPESLLSLRRLSDLGAEVVSPIITWYVANPRDPHLHPGRDTPSDEDLAAVVEEAHRLGLRVVLKLHVDCEDGQWRGHIDPNDKEAWFRGYGALLRHYAELAEAHGVEGLVIGAELVGVSGPAYTPHWRSMIVEVRQRFSGFLTYSAQWGSGPPGNVSDPYREFDRLGFWRDLDYLGISAYFELAEDGPRAPSYEELLARWEEWRRLRVEPFQARYDMPLLFTEVGYRSTDGAAYHPWDGGLSRGVNLQLQEVLYSALFESWARVPWFSGAYFWFWPAAPEGGDSAVLDYPPAGKPAEQVLRRWYGMLDDMEQFSLKPAGAGGTISVAEGR